MSTTTGIFADSDDDEEDEKYKAKSAAASKPVSFIKSRVAPVVKSDPVDHGSFESHAASTSSSSSSSMGWSGSNQHNYHKRDSNFGAWEVWSKGIGSKLLGQMGYQPGKGLGKNLQGIPVPIESKLRPSGVGLGTIKEHKQDPIVTKPTTGGERSTKIKDEIREARIRAPSKPKVHKRYEYKSTDELINDELMGTSGHWSDPTRSKVIDLRGPEQKVYTSYRERFSLDPDDQDDDEYSAIDRELMVNDRNIRKVKQRMKLLQDDRKLTRLTLDKEESYRKSLNDLWADLSSLKIRCETNTDDDENDVKIILEIFEKIQHNHPNEYKKLNLDKLFLNLLYPKINWIFKNWKPLSYPHDRYPEYHECIKGCHKILLKRDPKIYEKILWIIWLPAVRRDILSVDSIKTSCLEIINFIELWKPLLPNWMCENLMATIVMPRIQTEVDSWDPLSDPIPIHSWIHPWLPMTQDHDWDSIFITIRRKLSQALVAWHPSDSSARLILEPWKHVFSPETWDSFMATNILMKLSEIMSKFIINPCDQKGLAPGEEWSWIFSWSDLLSPLQTSSLLTRYFFPRWLNILYQWLTHATPDYDEIVKWYLGWKSLIPTVCLSVLLVQEYLRKSLEMMDHAVSSPDGMMSYKFNMNDPVAAEEKERILRRQKLLSAATASGGSTTSTSSSDPNINFKQMVQKRADEKGILFMPISNRSHEGKQVYQLADHKVFLDRSVVFLYNSISGKWNPMSLQSFFGE